MFLELISIKIEIRNEIKILKEYEHLTYPVCGKTELFYDKNL
jgi:hypothetical protein